MKVLLIVVGIMFGALQMADAHPFERIIDPPVMSEAPQMRCPVLALLLWYPWNVPHPQPMSQGLIVFDLPRIAALNYALHHASWAYAEIHWVWPLHGLCGPGR